MTLEELRTLFIKRTGAYSLVGTTTNLDGDTVPDYTIDGGANFYINAAQKWLDENCLIQGEVDVEYTLGEYTVDISAILHSVRPEGVSLNGLSLLYRSKSELEELYGAGFVNAGAETPMYWSLIRTGTAINLVVLPVTPDTVSVSVAGVLKTPALVDGDETNWWTDNHADKLLYVAIMIYNNVDLNDDANTTITGMVRGIQLSIARVDIMNEIAACGTAMRMYE